VFPTITVAAPLKHTAGMARGTDSPVGDQESPDWQHVETLGLADIVMTILEGRKTAPSSSAAAISQQRHGNVFHVRVTLLDDPSLQPGGSWPEPPGPPGAGGPGLVVADFAVGQLGQDLVEAFDGNETIILKLSGSEHKRSVINGHIAGLEARPEGGWRLKPAAGPLLQPITQAPGLAARRNVSTARTRLLSVSVWSSPSLLNTLVTCVSTVRWLR
jgi:hypothetical protein